MNDDSTPPTDQDRPPVTVSVPANDAAAPRIDMPCGIPEEDLRLVDALSHELALEASNDPRPNTPEEDKEDTELLASARRRMSMTREQVALERLARGNRR